MVGVYTERVANSLARDFDLATRPVPVEFEPLDHYMVWHSRHDADQKHSWFREQVAVACDRP